MSDFAFLQNPISKKWVIFAPRRAKRPDVAKGTEPVCPFCPGREGDEEEVFRLPSIASTTSTTGTTSFVSPRDTRDTLDSSGTSDWLVRVIPNKYPFAPIHEIIIHSPDHHKNFGELSLDHVKLILETYRQRYNTHREKGQVYIFHNRGLAGGESLPHPHTQLAVVPFGVTMDIPRMATKDESAMRDKAQYQPEDMVETAHFSIFCPQTSQWPDEVWIAPKARGRVYGEINDEEVSDLAHIINRLIQIMDLRHGQEFPFNFYIYPGGDWYLRLIPRTKTLGGFEVGTGIIVNTQDPKETIHFIKTHFENPDAEKIRGEHQAEYEKRV